MRPRLRLYTGDDSPAAFPESTVTISFGELARIVADASRFRRTWLSDFEGDNVVIPEDLYEVLTAYWQLRPGA